MRETGASRPRRPRRLWQTFAVPAGLFALSLGGLVLALLVEGWADPAAGLAAAAGLGAALWAVLAKR